MKRLLCFCGVVLLMLVGFVSACGTGVGPGQGDGSVSSDGGGTNDGGGGIPDASQEVCFTRDILPIFVSNCAKSGCHDSTTRVEESDFSSHASILASKGGEGVVPSSSSKSKVLEVITKTGRDAMPPPPASPLTAEQVALLKKWIDEGAKNTTCAEPTQCNTQQMTYTNTIQALMQKYCVGCHSQTLASGGVMLDNYNAVKSTATSGKLYPAIAHETGAKPMPLGGEKLPACSISQVKAWIDQGTPE